MVVIAPEREGAPLGGEQWRKRAACGSLPVAQSRPFIAATLTPAERAWAVGVCRSCPVQEECYRWAASQERFQGVAGGRAWMQVGTPAKADKKAKERYRAVDVAPGTPRPRKQSPRAAA